MPLPPRCKEGWGSYSGQASQLRCLAISQPAIGPKLSLTQPPSPPAEKHLSGQGEQNFSLFLIFDDVPKCRPFFRYTSVGELGKKEFNKMLQYKMQGNAELNWQGSLMAGTRNVLTSSLLGGAYLPALFGDNFLAAHNNFFNGIVLEIYIV